MDEVPATDDDFLVMRHSNLVDSGGVIMQPFYLDRMRGFLTAIRDSFRVLYKQEGAEGFAMEIEYKIKSDGQLLIKQARPWANFWATVAPGPPRDTAQLCLRLFPNPARDLVVLDCLDGGELEVLLYNPLGQRVLRKLALAENNRLEVKLDGLAAGAYFIKVRDGQGRIFSRVFIKT